jgi:MFS family permease
MSYAAVPENPAPVVTRKHASVLAASSVGTIFEWYDFFLYGTLAIFISRHFFSGVNETTAFILSLLAFSAGFAVRPFGALVFGWLGDVWGRKNTFLITLLIMGAATFVVGLLPSYEQIGAAAPWILVAMRMLQGLAVGGVYGGAATYVAEHAPHGQRGFYTSWIQTTATVALVLSLGVVLATRTIMGEEAFGAWGWRIPFLLSILLLGVTVWIQLRLQESPIYQEMKSSGKASKHPWSESFGNAKNLKLVLIALFGAVIGQAVVWYTGQFYLLFFIERVLKVDGTTTSILLCISLLIATPLYVFFGWLSDRIGRKPIILAGCALAALSYFPLFEALTAAANPDLARASAANPVTIVADPADCALQFDPIGTAKFNSSCDIAKAFVAKAGVSYQTVDAPAGTLAQIKVGEKVLASFDGRAMTTAEFKARKAAWDKAAQDELAAAGYPTKADPEKLNRPLVILIIVVLMSYGAMVYGPIAATLVELFPTNIRYTSMSLPYHIGNGWFGGFLPTAAFAIVAATGNIYAGLWYPLVFSVITVVVGLIFLPETKDVDIHS